MSLLLYLLLSGDVLLVGLGAVALGVATRRWRNRPGVVLVWIGVALAFVSAVPVHLAAYALLLLAAAAWQVHPSRLAAAALVLVVSGVSVIAVRWRHGSVTRNSANTAVFVVGDSLSAGIGASKEGTWPQLLSKRLNVSVSNLAQAGATLALGISQVQALPPGPALVLVELGGNDVLGGSTPQQFESDLRMLLDAVVRKGRLVLMFELPLLPGQSSYGRIQRDAAREHGVGLIPRRVLAGAVALRGHTQDGLHLTAAGHAWMAARVAEIWGST
jgi:acyl-CoA thioesterase-1